MKVELIETRTLDGTAGTSSVRFLEGKGRTRKRKKITTEQVAGFLVPGLVVEGKKKKTREVEDNDKVVEPPDDDDDVEEEEDEDDERSESEDDTDLYEPEDDEDEEQEEEEDDDDDDDEDGTIKEARRSRKLYGPPLVERKAKIKNPVRFLLS